MTLILSPTQLKLLTRHCSVDVHLLFFCWGFTLDAYRATKREQTTNQKGQQTRGIATLSFIVDITVSF